MNLCIDVFTSLSLFRTTKKITNEKGHKIVIFMKRLDVINAVNNSNIIPYGQPVASVVTRQCAWINSILCEKNERKVRILSAMAQNISTHTVAYIFTR